MMPNIVLVLSFSVSVQCGPQTIMKVTVLLSVNTCSVALSIVPCDVTMLKVG